MADTKKIKIGVKLVSNHKKHQKRAKITKVKNVANPVKSRLCEKFHKEFAKKSQKISTHLLIMEVDFCPVLCILEVPVLLAFRGISHFVWYCKAVSDLS